MAFLKIPYFPNFPLLKSPLKFDDLLFEWQFPNFSPKMSESFSPPCLKDDVGRTPGQAALLYGDTQVVEIILAASSGKQQLPGDKVSLHFSQFIIMQCHAAVRLKAHWDNIWLQEIYIYIYRTYYWL